MNSQDVTPELSKKEKRAIWLKKYNEDNKELIRAKKKKYNSDNKDRVLESNMEYRNDNRDRLNQAQKEYRLNNKDKIKEYKKGYRKKNIKKLKEKDIKYYLNNKDKIKECRRKYFSKNKDKVYKYTKNKLLSDIQFKLNACIRSRLYQAFKSRAKPSSAVKDLGCTVEELKLHLESKFQPGMTWENHSLRGWHIDHIKPLASFDLTDIEQFKQACHYSNLQPLWATDNLSKGAKIIDKSQSLKHTANNTQSLQPRNGSLAFDDEAPKDPNGVETNDC